MRKFYSCLLHLPPADPAWLSHRRDGAPISLSAQHYSWHWNLSRSFQQPGSPIPAYWLPLHCTQQKTKSSSALFGFFFSFVLVDKWTELCERRKWAKKELLLWDLPEDKGILSLQSTPWAFVSNKWMYRRVTVWKSISAQTVKILSR